MSKNKANTILLIGVVSLITSCKYIEKFDAIIKSKEFRGLSKIQQHLSERLMLGDFDCEATMKIVDVVDNNSTTWKYYIPDFTHSINNFFKKYW